MIDAWLELPSWLMFTALAVGFGAVALAIFTLGFGRRTRRRAQSFSGVVPSYFSAVATLLALLTGFVASDTWERQKQAGRVLQSESDNVLALYDLSIAAAPDMSALRAKLNDYVAAVVTDEWPQMADGRSSARAAQALGTLLEQVALPRIAAEAGGPTQAAMLSATLRLRSDRGERLALNVHRVDASKWLALMILGVLTQVAIGLVHLENPRAHAVAQLVFTLALVSTLGLIAEHEWPFDGPGALQPRELRLAQERMAVSPGPADAGVPSSDKPL